MLLNFEHVSKSYGERQLLKDVTFYLTPGDRIGVVGVNGCGKSTLLRQAALKEAPDDGRVTTDPNVRIAYLAQTPEYDPVQSVLGYVMAGRDETAREVAEYEAVELLTKLGIPDVSAQMGSLSGGQRKRASLAQTLLCPCDVLILDEPTNHLDVEMINWLEQYLQGFAGAILFVSHDRYFLERVATQTAEVSFGRLFLYDGGYSAYLDGKARREEMEAASERKRQSILRRELIWVLQGPCARGTKSRERLERYEALKAKLPPDLDSQLGEIRTVSSRLGKKTIEFQNVTKSWQGRPVIPPFDFILLRDDRVGIVGGNGCGKSTLLNLMAGRLQPDTGRVETGETVKIGYFSQHSDEMDGNLTALQYLKERGEKIQTQDGYLTAGKLMEMFLFPSDKQNRLISKLSGGEKRRLFLLGILASAPNVLLLDEPTNDLDIPTLMVLENYLDTFPGAVVAVSHDRYFLDRVCRRTFVVRTGQEILQFNGGFTDYTAIEAEKQAAEKRSTKAEKKPEAARPRQTKLKFSFKEQREFETIDADIAALEQQLADNEKEQEANATDYLKLQELQKAQEELSAKLDEKMDRWVYLNDLAEKIAAQ